MNEKRMYHLGVKRGEVGRYCILPGDPGRVPKIAAYLENPVLIAQNREYVTYSGTLLGELVTVTSTGIGGPSAAIAVEELHMAGADTFLRVGTCGGIAEKVVGGDLVIATAAVRQEGTALHYEPIEFPAAADFSVLSAMVRAAEKEQLSHHVGIIQSKDSFYGEHSPERMPVANELLSKWDAWKKGGVLVSEMEAATVFVVSSTLGCRAGALFLCLWNPERAAKGLLNPEVHDTDCAVRTVVEALKVLIAKDKGDTYGA